MRRLLLFTLLFFMAGVPQSRAAEDLRVVLLTNPVASEITPDFDLTEITLRVVDSSGAAVPDAYLSLQIDAPPGNAFVSTDFPIVENTQLLAFAGTLPEGELTLSYILPIRGNYQFHVAAGRSAKSMTFQDSLPLKVRENRAELRNLWLGILLLLGIGTGAGYLIGRGNQGPKLLLLLLGLGLGTAVYAHGDIDDNHGASQEIASQNGLQLSFNLVPGVGSVGSMNQMQFELADTTGALLPDSVIDISFWHLEDDKPVFTAELPAVAGTALLDFQFFDGAEHEIRLIGRNGAKQVALDKHIDVEGFHPPTATRVKSLVYILLVTLAGILFGLKLAARGIQV